jgi:ketosteroid isomerase-like protein
MIDTQRTSAGGTSIGLEEGTEGTLRQLMEDQAAAMRARDADYLVSRYTADAVRFDLAPPLQHGGDGSLRDAEPQRAWFATFDGPIDYEIRDLKIIGGDDFAVCQSLDRLSATPTGTTERFDLWFRSTVCWRRSRDTWQIVHEHVSTPFYMDGSMRAAVDLQP